MFVMYAAWAFWQSPLGQLSVLLVTGVVDVTEHELLSQELKRRESYLAEAAKT